VVENYDPIPPPLYIGLFAADRCWTAGALWPECEIQRAWRTTLTSPAGHCSRHVRADDLHVRKKLPFLPLGKSETWLQITSTWAFSRRCCSDPSEVRPAAGWFEIVLAWLFVLVSGSGMVGLFFSRVLPRRLATRGGEVYLEKIPPFALD